MDRPLLARFLFDPTCRVSTFRVKDSTDRLLIVLYLCDFQGQEGGAGGKGGKGGEGRSRRGGEEGKGRSRRGAEGGGDIGRRGGRGEQIY